MTIALIGTNFLKTLSQLLNALSKPQNLDSSQGISLIPKSRMFCYEHRCHAPAVIDSIYADLPEAVVEQ